MGETKEKDFTARFVGDTIVPIEKGAMTDTGIKELGGRITKVEQDETTKKQPPKEHEEEVLKETLPGNQEITIDEDGTQRDAETGEIILQGGTD